MAHSPMHFWRTREASSCMLLDLVPSVLEPKQVHFLASKGYMDYSAAQIGREVVAEKNKGGRMVRLATVCQILWFSIGQSAELHKARNNESGAYYLEVHRAHTRDIVSWYFLGLQAYRGAKSIYLKPNTTMADMFLKASERAEEGYTESPLNFVGHDQWSWNIYWAYRMGC